MPKRKLRLDDLPFDELKVDIPVDRDLVNDPPFLRYLLRKTFSILPTELAEVPWIAKRAEIVKHLSLVHHVFDEEVKREYATFEDEGPDEDEDADEEGEDEDEDEDDDEDDDD